MSSSVLAIVQIARAWRAGPWALLVVVGLSLTVGACAAKRSTVDVAEVPSAAILAIGPMEADRARIQAHLSRVERELRTADVSHLRQDQVADRSKAMNALHDYWVAGVFPQNRSGVRRNPVFIDEAGRACAVAHLMKITGHDAMAHRIADGQNRAYAQTIADPALDGWLDQYGLSIDDAAKIQPSYCPCPAKRAEVCGSNGFTYVNRCTAEECAGVTVVADGACGADDAGSEDLGDAGSDDNFGSGRPANGNGGCAISRGHQAIEHAWIALAVAALMMLRRRALRAKLRDSRAGWTA